MLTVYQVVAGLSSLSHKNHHCPHRRRRLLFGAVPQNGPWAGISHGPGDDTRGRCPIWRDNAPVPREPTPA